MIQKTTSITAVMTSYSKHMTCHF